MHSESHLREPGFALCSHAHEQRTSFRVAEAQGVGSSSALMNAPHEVIDGSGIGGLLLRDAKLKLKALAAAGARAQPEE